MPEARAVALNRWFSGFARRRGRVLSLILGGFIGLGQEPFGLVLLALPAMAGLILVLARGRSAGSVGLRGALAGAGYAMVSMVWIIEPFLVDVLRHGWMAPFALLGMSLGFGFFWGTGFWAAWKMTGGRSPWLLFAAPVTWTLAEVARSYVFTGLPWNLIGYVWVGTPVYGLASWVGPHGMTLLTVALASSVAFLPVARRLTGAGLLLLLAMVMGSWEPSAPPVEEGRPIVRLVQPNAPQHQKWDPKMMPVFYNRQLNYSAAPAANGQRPDLIVWPEVAVPFLLNAPTTPFWEIAGAAAGSPVALGIRRVQDDRPYNSLVVLDKEGVPGPAHDKYHLVPFGEYLPFSDVMARMGFYGLAVQFRNAYAPGPGPAVIDFGTAGIGQPLICYEVIFPHEVRRAPERPDFLLQITNDAWFGVLVGPSQHFAQARARSIELGLPLVRVANTGISAVIDGHGRVVARLPQHQPGWLDAYLPPPLAPTLYARTGDIPVLLLLLLSIMVVLIRGRENHVDPPAGAR